MLPRLPPRLWTTALQGAALSLCALGLLACDAILGITPVQRDPTGSGGGTAASSSTSTASGSGGSRATSSATTGGSGGQAVGSFSFAINAASAVAPYGGTAYLDVEADPVGGFAGDVTIGVQGAPTGFVFKGTTIPAGKTKGKVEIGASGGLALGTMFTLKLTATAGALVQSATVPATVTGKPGSLVDAFGVAGVSTWKIQSDGGAVNDLREIALKKILATGYGVGGLGGEAFVVARLAPNGAFDPSWNAGVQATATFCGCTKPQEGHVGLRLIDGRIFAIGNASKGSGFGYDVVIQRFKADGTPDVVAGDKGQVLLDLGGDEEVFGAELTKDEHVMVVGTRTIAGVKTSFVTRFESTYGDLDTTFNSSGSVFGPSGTSGRAVAVDSADRTILALQFGDDVAVARVTPAGVIEKTLLVPRAGVQVPVAVKVLPDDSVIVAASTDEAGSVLLIRVDSTFALDATFGQGGMALFAGAAGPPVGMGVFPDGRIVVAGNNPGPYVARFLADGTSDPTFGGNGTAITTIFLGQAGSLQSMNLASDGSILVGGVSSSFPTMALVAKLWN